MMAIRKASEVAEWVLWPAWDARETEEQGYAAMAAQLTADRFRVVERMREIATHAAGDWTAFVHECCNQLESEIKAAASTEPNDL